MPEQSIRLKTRKMKLELAITDLNIVEKLITYNGSLRADQTVT